MKNETRILINGLLGDRWETEEDMYNSMAYDIAEDQVVADNAMGFGLANATQDQELSNDIYRSIAPLIDDLAAKLLKDLDRNKLINMYVRSKQ
tara:strand:- start:437 stop:715 length:279 start_codon:yes stop_codon:yes gene_type:complete